MRTLTKCTSVFFLTALLALGLFGQPALAQIAPGVTQSAAHAAIISGTVVTSSGTPVVGADVRLTGPSIFTTKSDDRGSFSFTSVPWGNYQLSVTSSLGVASRTISVNGDLNVAIQYQPQSGLRTIAHVSTTSAGASINVTPASIASITPSDYAFQGNTSWQQLLNQIPGVSVGGGLRQGVSCGAAIPGGPFVPTVLSINGAAPYETSVTLDGMPMMNVAPDDDFFYPSGGGSGTDVSFLPLSTFDTADIVRGPGANAPSIVDSIGGSFVLHAPGAISGDHFEFSAGNDQYGGIVSNAKLELQMGRLSAMVTYGINDSPGPWGTNHSVMTANAFWPTLVNGQSTVGYGYFTGVAISPPLTYDVSTLYCCSYASTAWTQHNGSVSLTYTITPSLTAQVFYAGSSTQGALPEGIAQTDFQPYGTGYTGSIAPGEYLLPYYSEPSALIKGESLLEEKLTDYVGNGVIRLAALQNNSFYQLGTPYDMGPNGPYKFYGTVEFNSAPTTPVNFNGTTENLVFFPYTYDLQSWTNNRDLTGSYAVQVGSQSHLDLGYVTSYYNAPSLGHCVYGGGPVPFSGTESTEIPTSASSTTNEFHVAFGTQVSERLALTGSWYFADGSYHVPNPTNYNEYSGEQPGSYTDSSFPYNAPRLTATWRANENVVLRAAAGGGFALPPLLDLVSSNSVTLPCTTICSESVTNLNLKPETSFGFDVGTDVRFNHATVLSFDLYRTNLFGQFYETQSPSGTYLGLPLFKVQWENLAQTRYEGINVNIQHEPAVGLYWSAALGLNRAYVVSVPPGFYNGTLPYTSEPCTNCVNAQIIPGINFNGAGAFGASVSAVPYANGTAVLGYRWAPGKFVDLQPTYYGNNNAYFEPAFVELDAHLGYAVTKNVTLFATVRNITGVYDLSVQNWLSTASIPTIAGANPIATQYPYTFPSNFFAIPYGPRAVTVTANFKT